MPETFRVELKPDAWWEIKERLTRGDRRRIDEYVQTQALRYVGALKASGVPLDDLRAMAGDGQARSASPDEDDIMLVVGTVSWSFADPITMEGIKARWDEDAEAVLEAMRARYHIRRNETEESRKNGIATLPSGPPVMAL